MEVLDTLMDGGFFERLGISTFNSEESECPKQEECYVLLNHYNEKKITETDYRKYQNKICERYPSVCKLNCIENKNG